LGIPLERPVYVYERAGFEDHTVFKMSFVTATAAVTAGVSF
jgi:hypothetical protein